MRPIVQVLFSKLSGADVRVLMAFVAVVLVLAIVGVAVKLYDRRRKRGDEAVALQARVSDALMVDPSLTGLPLTSTVRMPLWRRGPVMIELSGSDRIFVAPAGLRGAV